MLSCNAYKKRSLKEKNSTSSSRTYVQKTQEFYYNLGKYTFLHRFYSQHAFFLLEIQKFSTAFQEIFSQVSPQKTDLNVFQLHKMDKSP